MARKKTDTKPRNSKAPRKRGSLFNGIKWISGLLGAVALLGLGYFGYQAFVVSSSPWAYTLGALGFNVKNIDVEGRVQTRREDILGTLGLKAGDPIFNQSPEALKAKIESLPWVRTASVVRQLPHTVHIRILERRPMALWQKNQKFFVVDQEGVVIHGASVEDYDYLPLIVGEMTADKTAEFLSELSLVPALEGRIQAATLVDGRRWNLRLENGIDTYLPEDSVEQALQKLLTLIEDDLILEKNIRVIDLRTPEKVFLVLGEGISIRSREKQRVT